MGASSGLTFECFVHLEETAAEVRVAWSVAIELLGVGVPVGRLGR